MTCLQWPGWPWKIHAVGYYRPVAICRKSSICQIAQRQDDKSNRLGYVPLPMTALRAWILDHHKLAMLLLALALWTKALMPAGYMIGNTSKQLTVEICSDGLGSHVTKQIAIPMDGKSQPDQKHSKTDSVCAYSALAMASLAGADAPLLALALAFILALGFAAQTPAPLGRISYLRPPLRGPPAAA